MIEENKKDSQAVDNRENLLPAFYRRDYAYKAREKVITHIDTINSDYFYEMKCTKCEMCIRSQGKNILFILESTEKPVCKCCGSNELIIRLVDVKELRTKPKSGEEKDVSKHNNTCI